MSSVVIVGGGLMGLSTAFHLRRLDSGVDVTVLERATIGAAASGASAAGVRAMGRDPAERALALASLRRWPELDRELEGQTGYRRGGGLRIALDDKSWDAEQRADGVPLETLDAAAARELAPGIGPGCLGGVYSPIDGQTGAMETVEAFATAARRQGARVEEGPAVRALSVEGGRVVAVECGDGSRQPCDVAVVTAGAWTASLLAPHGITLPLHTRPLQMLLTRPAPGSLAPVLGCFERKISFKQLADGAFVIGPVPGVEGLLVAAGFSGHGFALSPMVGDVLARLALGREPLSSLWRDLRIDRPSLAGSCKARHATPDH